MARPKKLDRPHNRTVALPLSVDRATHATLPRNITGDAPEYGAYSSLVERLLRRWLAEQGVNPDDWKEDNHHASQ